MIEQFFKFCVVGGSGVFVDFGSRRHQNRAVHGVFQFAHVAPPIVSQQSFPRFFRQRLDGQIVQLGILFDKVFRQRQNIAFAVAQGGQSQIHDVQAEIQVFAESFVQNFLPHVAVGRRQNTHVDVNRLFPADAVDLTFLQNA